jgi:putative spermidine/putrescine transport system permease protein
MSASQAAAKPAGARSAFTYVLIGLIAISLVWAAGGISDLITYWGQIDGLSLIIPVLASLLSAACLLALWSGRRWGYYAYVIVALAAFFTFLFMQFTLLYPLLGLTGVALLFVTMPPPMQAALSTDMYRRPWLVLALLIGPPMLWMVFIYIGSLMALLVNSFFTLNGYTGQIVREFSLDTYVKLFSKANLDIIGRTAAMALAVTLADALAAFPVAYFMARFAGPRLKTAIVLSVLLPLWSSYLVRVYAWRLILAQEGILGWAFNSLGLGWVLEGLLGVPGIGGTSLTTSPIGIWLTFSYTWLPYMILPIQAALERVPRSVIEASADLGARPAETFWQVTLPLAFPGVVAGSIFTFSLTLGDYIIPGVLGNSAYYIGQAVYSYQGVSGNLPLAAALTMVPIVIMLFYLLGARRLGAFDAL